MARISLWKKPLETLQIKRDCQQNTLVIEWIGFSEYTIVRLYKSIIFSRKILSKMYGEWFCGYILFYKTSVVSIQNKFEQVDPLPSKYILKFLKIKSKEQYIY